MRASGAIAAERMRALVRTSSRRAKAGKHAALEGRVHFIQHGRNTFELAAEQAEQRFERALKGSLNCAPER